jgi:hypothetical protein
MKTISAHLLQGGVLWQVKGQDGVLDKAFTHHMASGLAAHAKVKFINMRFWDMADPGLISVQFQGDGASKRIQLFQRLFVNV